MAEDLSDVDAVIEKNMAAFDKPGVLSVRPGFKVTKDWLTNTKSIVVTVRRKVADPRRAKIAAMFFSMTALTSDRSTAIFPTPA